MTKEEVKRLFRNGQKKDISDSLIAYYKEKNFYKRPDGINGTNGINGTSDIIAIAQEIFGS